MCTMYIYELLLYSIHNTCAPYCIYGIYTTGTIRKFQIAEYFAKFTRHAENVCIRILSLNSFADCWFVS